MQYPLAIVPLLLLAMVAECEAQPPDTQPVSDEEIERLIQQLGADTFIERQDAHRKLTEIGKPAIAAVKHAMDHGSPEVRGRAKAIFNQMFGPGLVVYLPMNSDQLRVRHTQFPSGTEDRDGRPDQAIHFPGKGYLILADHPLLDADHQFALAAWIHPTKIEYTLWQGHEGRKDRPIYPWGVPKSSWAGHFVCCKWDSEGSNGDYIFAITPSGRLGLGVADRDNRGFVWDSLVSIEKIQVDKWTHVAATFDHGYMKLYINGELVSEKRSLVVQHTNRSEYARDDVYIGDFWNNAGDSEPMYNFHGAIDEFCIFRKTLTNDEIRSLMNITQ